MGGAFRVVRYLSLFSGIEAASVAWQPLGWECVGVAEVEPFPCAVLAHHYPDVPNLGDVTKITSEQIAALGPIDLVVGGSPCQDLSVAGRRSGLSGERSSLFHEQLRIFHAARTLCGARFLLWENVPGAFTSNKTKDFAQVVGTMAGLNDVEPPENGWGREGAALGDNGLLEWAVLDAQWFGLAQRRKRVFALLDTGDWANRPPILLERESLRGDTPPSRETGQDVTHPIAPSLVASGRGTARVGDTRGQDAVVAVAPTLLSRTKSGGGLGDDFELGGGLLPCWWDGGQVSQTLDAVLHKGQTMPEKNRFPAVLQPISEDGTSRSAPTAPKYVCTSCGTPFEDAYADGVDGLAPAECPRCGDEKAITPAIAIQMAHTKSNGAGINTSGVGYTLDRASPQAVAENKGGKTLAVRRITPVEAERLQGFPDNWTRIPWRNKPAEQCPDGPRYKAIGNSMAEPVMAYIGSRINTVSALS